MESTARIIEVDFVNRRRRTMQDRDALKSIGKHTAKFEAHMKKIEARKQAVESIGLMCQILSMVFFASVMACVLR